METINSDTIRPGVNVAIYPHLGQRLRMYGAIPPLPYAFMACIRITSLLLYIRLWDNSRRLRYPRACCHLAIALSASTLGRRILRISIYEVPVLLKMSAHDIRQMLANRFNSVFYVPLSVTLQMYWSLHAPPGLKFTTSAFSPHSVFVFRMILRRNIDLSFTLY